MIKQTISILLLLFFCVNVSAQDSLLVAHRDSVNKVASDPNFITVSLLNATPGKEPYSILGHSFLRLKSPSNNLDIAYTFAMDVNPGDLLRFFQGTAKAGFVYAPTKQIINQYSTEGRGVTGVKLNLTPKEKQDLWRFLDNQLKQGVLYKVDYLHTNCSSMTANTIESILGNETIVYDSLPVTLRSIGDNYRKGLEPLFKNYPWYMFFWNLTLGEHKETNDVNICTVFPQYLWDAWNTASIKDKNGHLRPMVVGKPYIMITATRHDVPFPITPMMAFGFIMLLSALSLITDIKGKIKLLGRSLDIILITIQTIISIWICYLLMISDLVATDWNWLVFVFNPLPIICWVLLRKKDSMRKVYLLFSLIPLVYIILTPLLPQVQVCPSLICLFVAFSLRAYGNYRKTN